MVCGRGDKGTSECTVLLVWFTLVDFVAQCYRSSIESGASSAQWRVKDQVVEEARWCAGLNLCRHHLCIISLIVFYKETNTRLHQLLKGDPTYALQARPDCPRRKCRGRCTTECLSKARFTLLPFARSQMHAAGGDRALARSQVPSARGDIALARSRTDTTERL